jgi:hypothetical protein
MERYTEMNTPTGTSLAPHLKKRLADFTDDFCKVIRMSRILTLKTSEYSL